MAHFILLVFVRRTYFCVFRVNSTLTNDPTYLLLSLEQMTDLKYPHILCCSWRRLVSNASATQRAGRAGRVGPGGRCYRLWPRADHGKLSEQDPPPIASADLVSLALAAAVWIDDMGHEQQPSRQEQMQLNSSPSEAATVAAVGAIRALPWVDPPPPAAWGCARPAPRLGASPSHTLPLPLLLLCAERPYGDGPAGSWFVAVPETRAHGRHRA